MNETCYMDTSRGNGNGYDLAVIGAGSAGFSAAITAAEQGAQVALIGFGTIGGTCVNVGCVPSKTLIRATETLHQARSAGRFDGIRATAEVENWQALISGKDELVASLRRAKYQDILPAYNGIAYLEGAARIVEGGVAVNGNSIDVDKVVIATGSSPTPPSISGIEAVSCLTSTTALELKELPKSLLVIGGGYIGCELAQLFSRAGTRVTLVCRSRLLPGAEPEISRALTGYFRDEGMTVLDRLEYRDIRRTAEGVVLSVVKDGTEERLEAEQVLATAGRSPNIRDLGLEEAGIELLSNGGIMVDDRMRTTKCGIYAAGDVTGRDQFVYMAAYGAKLAAQNALNGDVRVYDNRAMPWVVFTDPQLAGVGMSEADATEQGLSVRTSVLPLDSLPRAVVARDTRGLIKLVAERGSNRLLGAQILAPEGADSIQTAALAIKLNLTICDLAEMIFPYLTTVEGLKLAAQTFDMDVSRLSCCAG